MAAVASWLTMAALVILSIARRGFGWAPAGNWVTLWLVPVLTSAAVGYLTNYVAIWLLFRPYTRHGPFWGVIPRNQPRLAKSLGKTIPERLLPPAELARTITELAGQFLRDPAILSRVRATIAEAVVSRGEELSAFLLPYAIHVFQAVLNDHLQGEKLARFVGSCTEKFLDNPENRSRVASALVAALQPNVPRFASCLRSGMRTAAIQYINQHFGLMAGMLGGAEKLVDGLIEQLDWPAVEEHLKAQLAEPETHQMIADEVGAQAGKIRDYLKTEEARKAIEELVAQHSPKLEKAFAEYLKEKLPAMLEALFGNDGIWKAVDEKLLPYLQKLMEQELSANSGTIIERLDLPGRIEQAVNELNPREAHELINEVSGRELTLLQVLGYFLGAVAGMLMTVAL